MGRRAIGFVLEKIERGDLGFDTKQEMGDYNRETREYIPLTKSKALVRPIMVASTAATKTSCFKVCIVKPVTKEGK